MKLNLELNLTNSKDRKALRAFLDVLDDAPPEGLDVCSGATEAFDPARVNVWTSTEGAEMVSDVLNVAPNVDQVVTKTVDEPESPVKVTSKVVTEHDLTPDADETPPHEKRKKLIEVVKATIEKEVEALDEWIRNGDKAGKVAALQGGDKKEGPGPKPKKKGGPKPDARKIVEAVVGVKVGKGTEVEGKVEEVAETVDPEAPKISQETVVELRKLQVKLAKYQALDEMKGTIRDITGIQKGKLSDIPEKHGPALVDALTAIATRLEEAGK